jgi:hypothetical protein
MLDRVTAYAVRAHTVIEGLLGGPEDYPPALLVPLEGDHSPLHDLQLGPLRSGIRVSPAPVSHLDLSASVVLNVRHRPSPCELPVPVLCRSIAEPDFKVGALLASKLRCERVAFVWMILIIDINII